MSHRFICAALVFTVALPTALPARASEAGAMSIEVVLSAAAQRKLTAANEAVTVSSAFYGDPSPAGRPHVDEVGQIALARREQTLPAAGGAARFSLSAIPAARLRWIAGPTMVNVNVYSARQRFADNVLDCDFFDGPVSAALRAPPRLHCGLISEHPQIRALP